MNTYRTPTEAYLGTLLEILYRGRGVDSRAGASREIIGHQLAIQRPDLIVHLHELEERKLNPAIGALEALQLLGQVSLPEVHVDRVRVFGNWLDDGIFEGAYGQRVHGQLRQLVTELESANSRQAVLTIFDGHRDLNIASKDVPCTLTLQFFIRNDRLILRTSMRSNDGWRGLPYDMVQFITLQAAVAAHFDLRMGQYQHTVGSMHLYESDIEPAADLLDVIAPKPQDVQGILPGVNLAGLRLPPVVDLFPPRTTVGELSSWARRALVEPRTEQGPETSFMLWLRQSAAPKEA